MNKFLLLVILIMGAYIYFTSDWGYKRGESAPTAEQTAAPTASPAGVTASAPQPATVATVPATAPVNVKKLMGQSRNELWDAYYAELNAAAVTIASVNRANVAEKEAVLQQHYRRLYAIRASYKTGSKSAVKATEARRAARSRAHDALGYAISQLNAQRLGVEHRSIVALAEEIASKADVY